MNAILDKFDGRKILVIGDLILDEFIWGEAERLSPEAPVPVVIVRNRSYCLGGAANVAYNLHSLGAEAILSGYIGRDREGDLLFTRLKLAGINSGGVMYLDDYSTVHKTRVIAHSQQVVRYDRECKETKLPLKRIKEFISNVIKEVDGVILEDYGKGAISSELVEFVIDLSRDYNKIVGVDPKQNHFAYYRGATIVTPNKTEAELAVGFKITGKGTLERAGEELLGKFQVENVLMTAGSDGMYLFRAGDKVLHLPTVAKQVYDVSGAGDTVIASVVLALASGASLLDAVKIANYAAGIVVTKLGTSIVTRQEIKDEVNK